MTSKISLFNAGIFKMTLKRFIWGAVAYFAMLFMSCVFPILMLDGDRTIKNNVLEVYGAKYISYFIALIVPIFVCMLIARCIHSKKQNIFISSLPVGRTEFFISSALAGFLLMALPVVLNGLIMLFISFGYSNSIFSAKDCISWVEITLVTLTVMYSIALLSSTLTGNSFMSGFLYVFINALPCLVVLIIQGVAFYFVSGATTDLPLTGFIIEHIPVSRLHLFCYNPEKIIFSERLIYAIITALIYLLSWYVFKIRRSERTGDVSAFKWMNSVLKYTICVCASMFMIFLYSGVINKNLPVYTVIFAAVIAIVYFGCEMILKKSVRVFKSYKGLIAFAVIFFAVIEIISLTGFFGYSTHIPKPEDIAYAGISDRYINSKDIPVTGESEGIAFVVNSHKELINGEPRDLFFKGTSDGTYLVNVIYKLKNGKEIKRTYNSYEKCDVYERELYKFEDYKKMYNPALSVDAEEIHSINIYGSFSVEVSGRKEIAEFLEIYKRESAALSYDEYVSRKYADFTMDFELYIPEDDMDRNFGRYKYMDVVISNNFKESLEYLKQHYSIK